MRLVLTKCLSWRLTNMPLVKCIEQETNGNISLKDKKNKCKIVTTNSTKKLLKKVKVDGCLPIVGKKCDFAIIDDLEKTAILFELKGSDINHAIKQIENSIKWFSAHTDYLIRYCIIVHSGRHPKETASLSNKKEKLKNKYKIILKLLKSGNSYCVN